MQRTTTALETSGRACAQKKPRGNCGASLGFFLLLPGWLPPPDSPPGLAGLELRWAASDPALPTETQGGSCCPGRGEKSLSALHKPHVIALLSRPSRFAASRGIPEQNPGLGIPCQMILTLGEKARSHTGWRAKNSSFRGQLWHLLTFSILFTNLLVYLLVYKFV